MATLTIPSIVEVPDDATHYGGCDVLKGDATWHKVHDANGVECWLYWSEERKEWVASPKKPPWVKKIPATWRRSASS